MYIHFNMWEKELAAEYRRLIWTYKVNLIAPSITVIEVDSYWGQWSPLDRKIKISKKLIDNYSWDVVINILKHEMAHQMDSEYFFGKGGHGIGFERACNALGVPQEFRSSSLDAGAPISSWADLDSDHDALNENHNLIRKVEKLLALAQSSNENEALIAMEKVMQIYETYNLKRVENKLKANYVYAIINLKKNRIESYLTFIGSVMQEFYFVEIVYTNLYDAKTFKSHQVIEVIGTKENVQMAEYIFHFLNHKVLSLWYDYAKKNSLPVKFKRSYMIGVLKGFIDKLRSIKTNSSNLSANQKDLILSKNDPDLRQFKNERFPRLGKLKSSTTGIYSNAYESGKTDGQSIVINKGISNNSSHSSRSEKLFLS